MSSVIESESLEGLESAVSRRAPFCLAVVALDLPGLRGGASAFRDLRSRLRRVSLVAVGPSTHREVVLDTLATGVDGYIPKSMEVSEMVKAFETVLSGHVFVPDVLSATTAELDAHVEARVLGTRHILTSRQIDVLQLLAEGQSNKQIARTLDLSESTVKVHLNAAFRALGVHSRRSALDALVELEGKYYRGDPALLRILKAFREEWRKRTST